MVIRLAADELFLATLIGCVTYRRLAWPDIIDYKPRHSRARLWHSKIYSNDLAFNSDFYAVHFLRDFLSFSNFRPFTLHHPTPGNA